MIINLIIKHLLPTTPALYLSSGPPGTPSRREREREVRGGGQEESEGGVGERRTIREGHHHSAGFFYTARGCFVNGSGQRVKLFDPQTKGTRRQEQSHAGKESQQQPPPPLPVNSGWHLQATLPRYFPFYQLFQDVFCFYQLIWDVKRASCSRRL